MLLAARYDKLKYENNLFWDEIFKKSNLVPNYYNPKRVTTSHQSQNLTATSAMANKKNKLKKILKSDEW